MGNLLDQIREHRRRQAKLGPRGYAGVVQIIVHEGEDAEKIISENIAAGEMGAPDSYPSVGRDRPGRDGCG
jgi:hypothetical protein